MRNVKRVCLTLGAIAVLAAPGAWAAESMDEAADTAEAFIYGRESKNEALLKEISDPEQYDLMAKQRSESDRELNENVKVEDVEIRTIDGDHAVAKATYKRFNSKSKKSSDVYLRRVDGKWEVTTPPEAAD